MLPAAFVSPTAGHGLPTASAQATSLRRPAAPLGTGSSSAKSNLAPASIAAGLTLAGVVAHAGRRRAKRSCRQAAEHVRATPAPNDLILRVARGVGDVHRTPVWLMRQAGRYMKDFRKYSERYPFRQRSETPEMATELSLQCWRRYGMDGVIVFSDILTPLPALGIDFDVVRGRGPLVMGDLARTLQDRMEGDRKILEVTDFEHFNVSHSFLKETLQTLRAQTEGHCSLLGFVGAPWTLAAYAVEGGSTRDAGHFKKWMYEYPSVTEEYLRRMTTTIANYAVFQVKSGAECIQIFDSWAHCLGPEQWQKFAAPHVRSVAEKIRQECPGVPIIYFANGGSSYLRDQVESLNDIIDVLGVDGHVRMAEAAQAVSGSGLVLQGNVDPFVLRHGTEADVRDAVRRNIDDAGGPGKHIMNLGHGVLQGTPEENVEYFVHEAQTYGAK